MKTALPYNQAKAKCIQSGIKINKFFGEEAIMGIPRETWVREIEGATLISESIFSKDFAVTETGWDIPRVCFATNY